MRISLLFPLLMILVLKLNWRQALIAAYAIAFVGAAMGLFCKHVLEWPNDYHLTFVYVPQFIVGCLLARHQQKIVAWYQTLRRSTKVAGVFAAIFLYTYPYWFLPQSGLFHFPYVDDQVTTLGVGILIVSALASSRASSLLLSRPLVALGKTSYSLYLMHAVCLLAAIHLLFGVLPIWCIVTIAAALTLGLTAASYFAVEIPSIQLGRRLAELLSARRAAVEVEGTPDDLRSHGWAA